MTKVGSRIWQLSQIFVEENRQKTDRGEKFDLAKLMRRDIFVCPPLPIFAQKKLSFFNPIQIDPPYRTQTAPEYRRQ